MASTVVGGYAGLVVLEYAGWARANPNLSMERATAFTKPALASKKPRPATAEVDGPIGAFYGASLFGLGYGLLSVFLGNLLSPSPSLYRFLRTLHENDPKKTPETFAMMALFGLYAVLFGLFKVASVLNALRPANPLLGLRLAWDALVVFLTYPEAKHPLVHKFCTPWLRPVSVRMAATGLVLVTVATSAFQPPEKEPSPDREAKPAAKTSLPVPLPARSPFVGARDAEAALIVGLSPDDFSGPPFGAAPTKMPTPPASRSSSDGGVPRLMRVAAALVVVPPVFLYMMIWFVGLTVLPTYFNYFEKPREASPPA